MSTLLRRLLPTSGRGPVVVGPVLAVLAAISCLVVSLITAPAPAWAAIAQPAPSGSSTPSAPSTPPGPTARPPTWIDTWEAAPQRPRHGGFDHQTLRMVVHVSIGGTGVRLRFANTFGRRAVALRDVHVARRAAGAALSGPNEPVTFDGSGTVSIAPGRRVTSDPLDIVIPPLTDIAVSVYLPSSSGPATEHGNFGRTNETSYLAQGNHAATSSARPFSGRTAAWFFLNAVSVSGSPALGSVVTLGDSITEGVHSRVDSNGRYPDDLARRLLGPGARGPVLGVANAGIGGNEVLKTSACCGQSPSMQRRLSADVLDQDGVRTVILLGGINDLGGLHRATSAQVIDGLAVLSSRLHARGLRVIGGTLTPAGGGPLGYGTLATDAARRRVNAWIRTTSAFDDVADFDAAVKDPRDSHRLRPAYDSGDHLHPNDAGYAAMARAVPVRALVTHALGPSVSSLTSPTSGAPSGD